MRQKIIACEVMKEELLAVKGDNPTEFEFVPQGLHVHPDKLNVELQKLLDETTGYDRVILSFGLCGGGAKDLKAGDFTLTIPRVHDCITLLLGSRGKYDEVRKEEPGTLYLSAGWVRGEAPVLSEYDRTVARYGKERTVKLLKRIYDAYRRVLFIATGSPDREEHLLKSREVADVLGLTHQEIGGDSGYLKKLISGPWDEEDFINVPPFGSIKEVSFLEAAG